MIVKRFPDVASRTVMVSLEREDAAKERKEPEVKPKKRKIP